jgi:hypothetical protein
MSVAYLALLTYCESERKEHEAKLRSSPEIRIGDRVVTYLGGHEKHGRVLYVARGKAHVKWDSGSDSFISVGILTRMESK